MARRYIAGTTGEFTIDFTTDGTTNDNTVDTALTTTEVVEYEWYLVPNGTTTFTWKSGSTAITGAMSGVANVPYASNIGFVTGQGENLVIDCGSAVVCTGYVRGRIRNK